MATTLFVDIYTRASTKIDDPLLTKVYEASVIGFCRVMYNYLDAAIPSFNNPIEEMRRLRNRTEPDGESDTFTGDGATKKFTFTNTPRIDSICEAFVDGVLTEATYDSLTHSMELTDAPADDSDVEIQWYFSGQFDVELYAEEKDILGMLTMLNWAEKEKNFKLDIRTLLGDKTYRVDASARSNVGGKVVWYESIKEDCHKKISQFAWNYQIVKRKYGGEPAWLHLSE
jgi:hypothetical protein